MERTDVVTAFLQRPDGSILLGRRSKDVKTYQNHWAGISGYLESSDPLLQAQIEIREETGLTWGSFDLVKRGSPVAVDDPDNDRYWRVHPFRFYLDDRSDSIKLDREHEDFHWCDPSALDELETVPDLDTCWQRVSDG